MTKARVDGKPIVYIGFGSITVPNPKLVTERVIRGVLKSKLMFRHDSPAADGVFPRRCASDYLQRLVRPDVKGWGRGCRVPRRMLLSTPATFVLFCLAGGADCMPVAG
jgi:hypothetical protein